MELQVVKVGELTMCSGEEFRDTRKRVIFEGNKLSSTKYVEEDRIDDGSRVTSEIIHTLYETSDGRLIVHIDKEIDRGGVSNTGTLIEITPDDLEPDGRFAELGSEAGFVLPMTLRPVTLDEALKFCNDQA